MNDQHARAVFCVFLIIPVPNQPAAAEAATDIYDIAPKNGLFTSILIIHSYRHPEEKGEKERHTTHHDESHHPILFEIRVQMTHFAPVFNRWIAGL